MLKVVLTHKIRFVLALLLVILLVLVRAFEDRLFYDPFLNYFKSDFNNLPLPIYDPFHLFIGFLFRYGINTVISLGILYVLFKDTEIFKFAAILYFLFFMILISSFYIVINFYGVNNNLFLFYIRRFLIQPIFVLVFIPAFYFQKLKR